MSNAQRPTAQQIADEIRWTENDLRRLREGLAMPVDLDAEARAESKLEWLREIERKSMSGMKDLLGDKPYSEVYPESPGYKAEGTSRTAAKKMALRAGTLKALCYDEIKKSPAAADQIAERINRTPFAVRPRITELIQLGWVRKSGRKHTNKSGMEADIVEVVPQISWQG